MNRTLTAALMAFVVVASMIAPASAELVGASAGPPAQLSDSGLPEHSALANESVTEDIPSTLNSELPVNDTDLVDRTRGRTTAGNHAGTMNASWIVINEKTGERIDQNAANAILSGGDDVPLRIAVVMNDTVAHEGREVAVPADVLEDSIGYRPAEAHGQHSSGDTWTSPIDYTNGYATWHVPKFSENTITWSSEINITSSPAADGSQYRYDLNSTDSADNFTIDVTGSLASEWDNESAAGVGTSSLQSISVGGNMQPVAGDGNDPKLTITGNAPNQSYNPIEDEGDGNTDGDRVYIGDNANDGKKHFEMRINPDQSGEIDSLSLTPSTYSGSDYGLIVDVYLIQETPDGNYGEGTQIATWDPEWGFVTQNITFDSPQTVKANTDYTLEFVSRSTDSDATKDHVGIPTDASVSGTWSSTYEGGSSTTRSWAVRSNMEVYQTIDGLSVSDGAGNSVSYGNINDTETVTKRININSDSAELNWSGSGTGSIDYTLKMKERTQTVDPTVEVNGHTTGYSGTLTDGTTTSLSTNTTWIQAGTNTVNVTVGGGTLSADAPTAQAGLDYSHEASDQRAVQYEAEQWSERYNVSKTFASDQSNAQLRIPFQATVHNIRNVETRWNGGTWSEPGTLSYDTVGNDLVLDLGSAQSGDTVEVRTAGSRVKVMNGSIEVFNPSLPGESLDSDVRVNSWDGSNSYILVGDTDRGQRVHFAYETTWSADDDHIIAKANGEQQLRLPNAATGSEARIQTIPVTVSPNSGTARVEVNTLDSDEPEFHVSPGASEGDDVDFTFVAAKDQTDYELYSKTHDVTRDFGTAQSPLTLTDDDSDETLVFRLDDGENSTGGGGGGGVPLPSTGDGGAGLGAQLPLLAGGAIAVLTAAILIRRRVGPWAEDRATTNSSSGGIISKITGFIADVLVAFADAVFKLGGAIRSALQTRTGKLAVASAVVLGAFAFDIITFTEQERTVLLGVTILLGAFVGLKRFDQFSWPLYGLISAATIIFVLSAMGTDLLGQLINSPMFPIVGIGGLYLGYKTLQAWREGQKTVVQVRGE